jgi:nitrogen fixation protein FixH
MGVVVIVNAILVYFAVSTWTGLDTVDHYRKGLAYNRALAAADTQAERGWSMAFAFEPLTAEDGHGADLSVTFADRDGQPIGNLMVEVTVVRPTRVGHDVTVALVHVGEGRYRGQVALALPGQWEARVHAWRSAETFRASHRMMVP